jgi:predicted HicB family RNase H-like nuclease
VPHPRSEAPLGEWRNKLPHPSDSASIEEMPRYKAPSGSAEVSLSLRLTKSMHKAASKRAHEVGLTLSEWIRQLIRFALIAS